ncbi:MAG: hypothetical protein NC419_10585 [Muribaculaceae bacterium]|nr:hypothetical protein [Muribaculaceae bacterium]
MDKRKWRALVCLIAAALAIELILCNFSSWKSLFYRNRQVFEQVSVEGGERMEEDTDSPFGSYLAPDGVLTLHVTDVDMDIHNLFFALDFSENEPVSYTVSLTDEGNHYPYYLPERVIMPGIPRSFYTNVYPAGNVHTIDVSLTLPAGSLVTVNGVCANARIPFLFSPGRFLFITFVLLLLYTMCYPQLWQDIICAGTKKQRFLTAAVILLLIVMAWKLAHVNPICVTSPWPHHKQYQELVEVMAQGHFYLDAEPSEGLINAPNPYDTIYLQANGIDYLADYAYYNNRYYVYFGVVPELLLYLPVYLLTGHHMPNYFAVFLFYCGFILSVFALYRELIKKWFPRTPYILYLLLCILTVCGGNYLFVIARPDLYDTPIMAANMFTVAGLWLWIKGKTVEKPRSRRLCLFLGSLSMALVAGCRPQMLLFSALAIPLFWEDFFPKRGAAHSPSQETFRRNFWDKARVTDAVSFCLPYLFVAAGIMYYNAARFGSPFDFGASYSLTSNDMTKRSFNLQQTLLGLWHYFLRPPVLESDFPFLQGVQIASGSYMGKLNGEYTYGGILTGNAFLWILFFIRHGKKTLQERGLYAVSLLSLGVSIILGIVDVTGAGILQRYMVDMVWGVWFGAVLLFLAWTEKSIRQGTIKKLSLFIFAICLLQTAYGFGIIFGNGDLSVNVRTSNPQLYYSLLELFRF